MSRILYILPIILLSLSLINAYGDQYGSGQYGRKRRAIPAAATQQAQQQQQAQPDQQQQAQFQPVRGPKKFSVNVADGIRGANQLRKEKWDNGTVTGMYANPLGNNKYQIINYIADDKGYRILSTKVVDDVELAALGGQGKFSPQSGKSAQIDITNDGESSSWTVTPDQINQGTKTQPEGRSLKDSTKADSEKDDQDHEEDHVKVQGKRHTMDMEADSTKDSKDTKKDKDDNVKVQGKRSTYGGPGGYMGSGGGYGGNGYGNGGYGSGGYGSGTYGKRSIQDSAQQSASSKDAKLDNEDSEKVQGKRFANMGMGMGGHGGMGHHDMMG